MLNKNRVSKPFFQCLNRVANLLLSQTNFKISTRNITQIKLMHNRKLIIKINIPSVLILDQCHYVLLYQIYSFKIDNSLFTLPSKCMATHQI